jgi:hypothetical protein
MWGHCGSALGELLIGWWFFVVSSSPRVRDRGEKSGASSSRTTGKPRAVPASRAIRPAESVLVGEALQMEGLIKEQMEAACAANEDMDPLECSTIAEVRSWIAHSSPADG